MDLFMSILGVGGAAMCIGAYFLLERRKLSATDPAYYLLNGIGAFVVLIAVLFSFDGGDMGAIVQELLWVIISIMGLAKTWKAGQIPKNPV